ncbi:MAG TPA: HEAT repeat domain-containing protein [Candidatus Nanopelagicales bacterium]|nr:HEAT repeat domain-containing protein [Candidatus Nanopelagicales bacterium]
MPRNLEVGPEDVIDGTRRQLDRLASVDSRRRILESLTRYLGVTGGGWISEHRRALRELLCSTGLEAIGPVLAEVERAPRAEVIEDAANVLAKLSDRAGALAALGDELRGRGDWSRRMTAVQAVGAMLGPEGRDVRRALLIEALADRDADIRDAAAQGLINLEDPAVCDALRSALATEQVDFVRASIEEALGELSRL